MKTKSNFKGNNIMTDEAQTEVKRGSKKGGTRKPQEFLGVLSMTDKTTGEKLDLSAYDVTLTSAANKDFKTVLAAVRNDPCAQLIEVTAPKAPAKPAA